MSPLLLFGLALALRLIGLRWGLPTAGHWYSYHPDERQTFEAVASLDFFSGDFNPNFFNYPSLYLTLVYVAHTLAAGLGLTNTLPPRLTVETLWLVRADITLAGRVVTALLGAATVPLVYKIGAEIGDRKTAILAALLLALLPGHIQHSHFATVNVPATFFVTLCLWLVVRALREGADDRWRRQQLLWAAPTAGLAAATKYNAGLVLVAPLAAWWFLRQSVARTTPVSIIGLAALGFFVGCPYSVLSFREFWGDGQNVGFAYELFVHPRQGSGDIFLDTGNGWLYHLLFNLPFAMTLPVMIVTLAGGALLVFCFLGAYYFAPRSKPGLDATILTAARRQAAAALIPVIWIIVYGGLLGFSQVRYMRYTLPLLPACCVLATVGISALIGSGWLAAILAGERILPNLTSGISGDGADVRLQAQKVGRLYWCCASVLVLFETLGASNVLFPFIKTDPRDAAVRYMDIKEVGGPVGLLEPPWFGTPPLIPLNTWPESQGVTASPDGRFQFVVGADEIKNKMPRWIMLNEFDWREKERRNDASYAAFAQFLEREYTLAADFKNHPPLELPGRAYVPHDFLYTNPEVRIYRRK